MLSNEVNHVSFSSKVKLDVIAMLVILIMLEIEEERELEANLGYTVSSRLA